MLGTAFAAASWATATTTSTDALIGGIFGTVGGGLSFFLPKNPALPPHSSQCPSGYTCSPKPAGCPSDLNCVPKSATPGHPSVSQPQQQQRAQASGNTNSSSSYGGGRYYTIGSGDTLWGIASRFYGSGYQWQSLYQRNRGVIGSNPNLIYPGERLVL